MAKSVGLIINPIAGMGGRVGLKGTDGPAALEQARALGAKPLSGERAGSALAVLNERLGGDLTIVTIPGPMGGDIAESLGIPTDLLPSPAVGRDSLSGTERARGEVAGGEGRLAAESQTSSADTTAAATAILDAGVDLLLFAGGDGTARDIFSVVGTGPPVLGIPTGVKMHSAVYATTPRAAGEAAASFLTAREPNLREAEVMDIDEEAFRQGRVSARLFGYLMVPAEPNLMQSLKSGSASGQNELGGIAADIAERMRDGALWIIGPGTTTRSIAEYLDVSKTLLGVDLYSRQELVASDATEEVILRHLDGQPAWIVVTPIGGQGYLFGRGNQQLSPEVIRRVGRDRIVVVATAAKLAGLAGGPFLVDTGDPELDRELAGYIRVVTGFRQESVHRIA